MPGTSPGMTEERSFRHNNTLWLWVPAFAMTMLGDFPIQRARHAKFDFSRTRFWAMEEGPSGIYATADFEGSRTAIATGNVN